MNNNQKAQRYDLLLNEYKQIENQIKRVPKLPLEQTISDLNSVEYTPENQQIVNGLRQKLRAIDMEVKNLFK
tara:strand:+ start:160 stop:375 length:216 start_codon:yes stop_codon:yes gene_type:complete